MYENKNVNLTRKSVQYTRIVNNNLYTIYKMFDIDKVGECYVQFKIFPNVQYASVLISQQCNCTSATMVGRNAYQTGKHCLWSVRPEPFALENGQAIERTSAVSGSSDYIEINATNLKWHQCTVPKSRKKYTSDDLTNLLPSTALYEQIWMIWDAMELQTLYCYYHPKKPANSWMTG